MIRNEMPHETYLEIASYYMNLGLDGDAVKVLEAAPDQAEIRYWQAYLLRDKSAEKRSNHSTTPGKRELSARGGPVKLSPIWFSHSGRRPSRSSNGFS